MSLSFSINSFDLSACNLKMHNKYPQNIDLAMV